VVAVNWLGIGLESGTGGLTVVDVVQGSPAVGRIAPGDRVVGLAGVDVDGWSQWQAAWRQVARARGSLELVVTHGGPRFAVELAPSLQLFRGDKRDIRGPSVSGMKCDNDCRCLTPNLDCTCQREWLYKGDGEHGGMVYARVCTAFDTRDWSVCSSERCGRAEYF